MGNVHEYINSRASLTHSSRDSSLWHWQAELTKKRLERAGKLTSALLDEGVRWKTTAETIQQETELLVGNVFLGSACIAYYGAFTGSYRQQLVAGWMDVSLAVFKEGEPCLCASPLL